MVWSIHFVAVRTSWMSYWTTTKNSWTAPLRMWITSQVIFQSYLTHLPLQDLRETVSNFKTTVERLNGVLTKIEQGEGSLGKLAHDDELYNNLTEASRELDLLLQDFRLNPKRYVNVSVFGKKQKEYELPEDDPAAQKQN